jgi:protein gp37
MNKTKIAWCDMTWNPIVGCENNCEYCYARKIANRFYGNFEPKFYEERLAQPSKVKKPKNIFVCSMADMLGDWVPKCWIERILESCFTAQQHRYLFLTKNPKRYREVGKIIITMSYTYIRIPEMWFGATATNNEQLKTASKSMIDWISIEPLHERLDIVPAFSASIYDENRLLWVVIGAETGNRKDKIIPKKEWVQEIVDVCRKNGTPVFMKESLREMMGDEFVQEFPWSENHD